MEHMIATAYAEQPAAPQPSPEVIERMREAIARAVDSADGNGSRITVSKAAFDGLIDALRLLDGDAP